jgi:hypothetical protein
VEVDPTGAQQVDCPLDVVHFPRQVVPAPSVADALRRGRLLDELDDRAAGVRNTIPRSGSSSTTGKPSVPT